MQVSLQDLFLGLNRKLIVARSHMTCKKCKHEYVIVVLLRWYPRSSPSAGSAGFAWDPGRSTAHSGTTATGSMTRQR